MSKIRCIRSNKFRRSRKTWPPATLPRSVISESPVSGEKTKSPVKLQRNGSEWVSVDFDCSQICRCDLDWPYPTAKWWRSWCIISSNEYSGRKLADATIWDVRSISTKMRHDKHPLDDIVHLSVIPLGSAALNGSRHWTVESPYGCSTSMGRNWQAGMISVVNVLKGSQERPEIDWRESWSWEMFLLMQLENCQSWSRTCLKFRNWLPNRNGRHTRRIQTLEESHASLQLANYRWKSQHWSSSTSSFYSRQLKWQILPHRNEQ